MFSATKTILGGALVALFGTFLLAGVLPVSQGDDVVPAAVTDAASPDTTEGPLAGLVSEEVEPGVLRIVSDAAGHDLDETHPEYRYDMDGIAIQPDGTVWLRASYSREDNEAHPNGPLLWALGQPGTFGATDGVPVETTAVIAPSDGTFLVIGADRVVRFDGEAFVRVDGPMQRRVPGGTLWLIPASGLSELLPDGEAAVGARGILAAITNGREWLSPSEVGRQAQTNEGDNCWTNGTGVHCWNAGDETTFLAGTPINQIAAAPDGSVWAVGGYGGDNGGVYRIALD